MKLMKKLVAAAMAVTVMAAAVPVNSSAFKIKTDFSYQKTAVAEKGENFENIETAAKYVRECFRTRNKEFVFSLPVTFDYEKSFHDVMLLAIEETYNSDEGDYIKYDINSIYCEGDYDGVNYYYNIAVGYYTSAKQEKYVDEKIAEILASLDLDNLDDYGKISAIYEYIINNVEYDYSEGNENKAKFSAYGALYNGKAVCQGFSQLFYRLAKEAGISCRIISGMDTDGGHAWNIAAIDGVYYLCDSTWDIFYDEVSDCDYFLKGYEDFDEADREKAHIASGEDENNFIITDFTSDEFKTNYPISKNAFDAENRQKGFTLGDVNIDGTVDSTDASLILNSYANLTIYGFSRINAAQELAADVNCDDSIDSVDASVVLAYYGYVSTGGNDSLENFIKKVK